MHRQKIILNSLIIGFILLFLITGCDRGTLPQIDLEGAFKTKITPEKIYLRAYCPEVNLDLTWPEQTGKYRTTLVIENIPGNRVNFTITSGSIKKTVLSPKTVKLEVSSKEKKANIKTVAADGDFKFAVVGDSQGQNKIFQEIIKEINKQDLDFVVHLGDMVPSGKIEEYENFLETVKNLNYPLYTVLGNHDIKNNGENYYENNIAPQEYFFTYKGYQFIICDNSKLGFDEAQLAALEKRLNSPQPSFIFMHVPATDPRGKEHDFLAQETSQQFLDIIKKKNNVEAVFNGHVHTFAYSESLGTKFITSGGAGAALYTTSEEGGFYHFVLVENKQGKTSIDVQKVDVTIPQADLVISMPDEDVVIVSAELEEIFKEKGISGESSYENQFGNVTGQGEYSGIPIRVLLELAGGMTEGQTLTVYSSDGYYQNFSYENVYEEELEDIQGKMVLALQYNKQEVPEWLEGYRLAFLPEDGLYSNQDCAKTSAPGQGWYKYQSAGARWVKNVVRLEVRE